MSLSRDDARLPAPRTKGGAVTLPAILSFDVESNGLGGPAFAVGAAHYDAQGVCQETFFARCPLRGPADEYVARYVLPALAGEDGAVTHPTARAMRNAFWAWMAPRWRDREGVLTVADCGWPVDQGLLLACLGDDRRREFQGPYPLHEVATLLYAAGFHPLHNYASIVLPDVTPRPHHPVYDAQVSALCARMALQTLAEHGLRA